MRYLGVEASGSYRIDRLRGLAPYLNLGVNYIDSTRLGELIAAHITVSRIGSHLKLAGTPARVIELLTLAGLGDVFERFPTVDAAIASLDAGLRDRD